MKFIFSLILGFLLATGLNSFADNIPSPPPLAGQPPELQHYLRSIYENLHRLPVTTTNPDGARYGKKGDVVLLITGGSYYLEVNIDSSNTWRGVALTNTP